MKLKTKPNHYAQIKGIGNNCPKCIEPMQRRERVKAPKDKTYFFTEWDYCLKCGHVQHYDEFKCPNWKEIERQQSFLINL